jgi:phospholipase/carboxylesterase
MPQPLLDCVEIDPADGRAPGASILWLHGLGADGHDFEPLADMLNLPAAWGVRYVFPHAPMRPVTINQGMVMRAWYDIREMSLDRRVDQESLAQSVDQLRALIARELALAIPSHRIVLAGFSQGGAVVLDTGLRYEAPLAGIMALSTYLPTADRVGDRLSAANRAVPIFMAHGTFDPMVPIDNARTAIALLEGWGYAPQWQSYPMQHEVCPEEIAAIRNWLITILEQGNGH